MSKSLDPAYMVWAHQTVSRRGLPDKTGHLRIIFQWPSLEKLAYNSVFFLYG